MTTNEMNEKAALLRRRAALWAHEYHDEQTADWFADWFAVEQPSTDFNTAFKEFQRWQAATAARLYAR